MNEEHVLQPMIGRRQPARADIARSDRLRIVDSPIVSSLLARLRDRSTSSTAFAAAGELLAEILLVEACRDVAVRSAVVHGFSGEPVDVSVLAERIAGVVILRAGLLFETPFRALLPDAPLYQLGIRRDESTLQAHLYVDNLPVDQDWTDRVFILDPMLATGGSASRALERVRANHSGRIEVLSVVCAPLGVEAVLAADSTCSIVTAALDDHLDERGYIMPGLGDAGDRLFGTTPR